MSPLRDGDVGGTRSRAIRIAGASIPDRWPRGNVLTRRGPARRAAARTRARFGVWPGGHSPPARRRRVRPGSRLVRDGIRRGDGGGAIVTLCRMPGSSLIFVQYRVVCPGSQPTLVRCERRAFGRLPAVRVNSVLRRDCGGGFLLRARRDPGRRKGRPEVGLGRNGGGGLPWAPRGMEGSWGDLKGGAAR